MQNKIALWALLFLALALLVLPYTNLLQSSLSKTPSGITRDMAQKFVEDDARTAYSEDAIATVSAVTQSGDQWKAEAEIELQPHSACPKLIRRHYSLMPILFVEERIVSTCEPRKPIGHRVEAIIAYAAQAPAGSYFCGFKAPVSAQEADSYCGAIDSAALTSFTQAVQGATWIVAWKYGSGTTLVALDDYANALATQ
ncbi:hypothetical protein H0O03_02625 [Candidatus Micrarchaeota archaeon]|nr:hypothetical protein [Candidatus Micrarchaeota archaeon]